ncbi:MAG TPA: hypothetical protein PLR99_00295 [Polyangiaceae bacterium]|nr:hypothetical protein [Polyangiaceae bacterium]
MDLFQPAYIAAWARAFVLTQAVEAPIYRRVGRVPVWAALAPSAITHPFVWFAFPRLQEHGVSYLQMAAVSEAFAWAVEAAFLALTVRVPWRRACLLSLLANAASVVVGLTLREFGLV